MSFFLWGGYFRGVLMGVWTGDRLGVLTGVDFSFGGFFSNGSLSEGGHIGRGRD